MVAILLANDHEHPFLRYPVKSICSPVYRRKRHRAGLFSTAFFFLVLYFVIKPKRGDWPYIFTGMKPLKTFFFFVNGNCFIFCFI